MKKIMAAVLVFLFLAVTAGEVGAVAGSCVASVTAVPKSTTTPPIKTVMFVCTGSSVDGSIPDRTVSAVPGYYLYTVTAYPTAGGPAPDAADVFVLDANGEDLLGSVDAGTTAKNGLNLIHATLKKTTFPYSTYLQQSYFPAVTGVLTLKVLNQATVSAKYTIELVFVR